MSKALFRGIAESAYEQFEHELDRVVASFVRRYGGDIEEAQSEALVQFMEALVRWTPKRGSFERWLKYRVRMELLELKRLAARRAVRVPPSGIDPDSVPVILPEFDVHDFLSGLSPDAAMILRMILLDEPLALRMEIAERGEPSPKNIRLAVRKHLRDLGWDTDRIDTTFNEIKCAL